MKPRPPEQPLLDAPVRRAGFWRRLRRGLWKAQDKPIAPVGERKPEPIEPKAALPLTEAGKGDLDGL